jgi:carboxypeptidase PM20D1
VCSSDLGGHSSQPPKHTPIARLSAFVNYCETHKIFRRRISEAALEMIKALGDGLSGALKYAAKGIDLLTDVVVPIARRTSMGNAVFATTMVFTMSGGATAPNIIPQEAHVVANLRFAPDDNA